MVNSKPIQTPEKLPSAHRPKSIYLVMVSLAIILIALGAYLVWRHKHNPAAASGTGGSSYSYIYKNLILYGLAGKTGGSGLKIKIPAGFGVKDGAVDKYTQASYSQVYAPNGPLPKNFTPVQIAHFAAASLYSSTPFTADFKDNYGGNLASTSGQGGLQDFLGQRLPSGYTVTLGAVKSLPVANMGGNAWVISYEAKAGAGQNPSVLPDLTGEVIAALGKQTTYYVMFDAISGNWQANQDIWLQVVDSIRVDQ